jgi:FkbM family methyltransferase
VDEAPPQLPLISTSALGRLWTIAGPIRSYVRKFPFHRGKGVLIRRILLPILPAEPAVFEARLPGGGRVFLHPRETLGFATILNGGFETAEIACAIELARPGLTAVDVGANIGIYTVALARAVGSDGQVLAIEPDAMNVRRLRDNLARNSIANVRVVEAAAGDRAGAVELRLADDRAYNSVVRIEGRHADVGAARVDSVLLDRAWEDIGRPAVSFVKIDVEGSEATVLRGAQVMITANYPSLLVEANDEASLALLRSVLEPLGYRRSARPGFQPWNHLFLPTATS